MNWTKTIARQNEKHLSFGMCRATRGFTIYIDKTTHIKTLWIFHHTYCTWAIHNLLSYQLCKFSIPPGRPFFSRNNKSDKDILLPDLLSRLKSLRPRQNGRPFADETFKRIILNENIRISTDNSLKFVPNGLINNIPALVLIMAWRRPGDKPLS